jgi:tetratricopeptide (TPR) repeat protein
MLRREKIEAMLVDQPDDIFLRYSLAMELDQEGRHDESLARLQELGQEEPPYVPALFMAGKQLARLERPDEARTALESGITAAKAQGNSHAAGEMSEFLELLP